MNKPNLKQINEVTWEIPKTGNMKVPARIIASKKLVLFILLQNLNK